jgi:hypothetical protein
MFCPQCGNPIGQAAVAPTTTVAETIIEPTPVQSQPQPQPQPRPRQPPPQPRHHDGVKARVEKLRHVSSVMIDQAAYDPSLRFLLVAAAFFILFLVLLIMSKVIG